MNKNEKIMDVLETLARVIREHGHTELDEWAQKVEVLRRRLDALVGDEVDVPSDTEHVIDFFMADPETCRTILFHWLNFPNGRNPRNF